MSAVVTMTVARHDRYSRTGNSACTANATVHHRAHDLLNDVLHPFLDLSDLIYLAQLGSASHMGPKDIAAPSATPQL